MRDYPKPNAQQLTALRSFAHHEGRHWKSKLLEIYWYNARLWRNPDDPDTNEGSILHGLRNSHGPSWLLDFRFPKEEGE